MGYDLVSDLATVKAEGVPTPGKKESHVRFISPGVLLCRHCGDSYAPAMPIPINLLNALLVAFADEHGKHELSPRGLVCNFCFKFGHHTFSCPRLDYEGNPQKWMDGPDTGTSSQALWRVMMGQGDALTVDSVPHDAEDFGRAHRLLMAIPGWRARIGEMLLSPSWKPLVEHWDELERLYNEEFPTGSCPKLYARMKELER